MRSFLKVRQSWLMVLLLAFALLQACSQKVEIYSPSELVVDGIRTHYESGLDTLPLSLQRHYAQRLYRVTGDERFIPYQQRHAEQLIQAFQQDVNGLREDADYVLQRDAAMLARRPLRTERQIQRAALLNAYPGMLFVTDLAFRMVQLDYYGLLESLPADDVSLAKHVLRHSDVEHFLLSEQAIRHYAAQAANQVWFLYQLNVVDLRDAFSQRFQATYPAMNDPNLSRAELHNKIYGMTHIVIAASRYYQDTLPQESFSWVTDYFIDQLPLLLETATEDILAEVGISLALTGQVSHPAVEDIRNSLIASYDPISRMIPSPSGSTDFKRGEHRNVLAVMLLIWPNQLYPGPFLDYKALHIEPQVQ